MTFLNPSSLIKVSGWKTLYSKGETSIKEFLALVDESIKESNTLKRPLSGHLGTGHCP